MSKTDLALRAPEELREALEAIEGVRRAFVEGPPYRIHLICEAVGPGAPPPEAAARAVLLREAPELADAAIEAAYTVGSASARRVRFVGIDLARPRVGFAVALAKLEWEGTVYEGRAEGEGGSPCELRVCAQSTMHALEAVLGGEVRFQLVGVKAIRIFDHDLISVLLRTERAPGRQLIGASLVTDDFARSTALAVLNATNRLLGNYLTAAD